MTQEEKAKRYDEAIERARALNNGTVDIKIGTTTCEYIFPELKESEDERIRKELIDFVKSRLAGFPECGRFIAWLEKQVEKPQGKSAFEAINDENVGNQNCVKPTNKVEPKFKIGDWVVDNYNCVWKIERILNQFYILECPEGGESCPTINWVDKTFHLWNIQDAKNGDVLFHSDSASNGIFIFKEISQRGSLQKVICYCDYDSEDGFCLGENHTCCWADSKILHPATKEQRDLLFQTMKEAGYKWDADNKELKKEEAK